MKRAMCEQGVTLKQAVNDAIRAGMRPRSSAPRKPLPTFDMGEPLVDISKAVRLAGELEDHELSLGCPGVPDVLLVDANVLLHAVNERSREHVAARS